VKPGRAAAKPYARALHDLAKERRQTDAIARELEAVAALVAGEPPLRAFFGRPWVSASAKWGVVVELATRWGLSPLARDFIALVARQGRADHLETIAAAYRDLVDEDLGRVRARVRAAVPLTPSEHERLQQRVGRWTASRCCWKSMLTTDCSADSSPRSTASLSTGAWTGSWPG